MTATRLVADIGGTNARFALCGPDGRPVDTERLTVADHPDIVGAAKTYLRGRAVSEAVFAGAGPVVGDRASFTNSHWSFSIEGARRALGLERLAVINDFVAQALAVPALSEDERIEIKPGEADAHAPIGVIGPGTGLGVGALIPTSAGWRPIPSEGGHVSLSPFDEVDAEIWKHLRRRYGHVSNERVLSGPGLVNLARSLAALAGETLDVDEPSEVSRQAAAADDSPSAEALRRFSRLLGSASADLALMFGARGGVFVGGGLCKRLGPLFDVAWFRQGFLGKGRLEAWLVGIPAHLVTRKDPGLLGAASFRLD